MERSDKVPQASLLYWLSGAGKLYFMIKWGMGMKKALVLLLALTMVLALAGCGQSGPSTTATATPLASASAPGATASAQPTSWAVKIGDYSLLSTNIGTETVTKTLKKVNKDGSMKDQKCTGYPMSEILELADVKDFKTITLVAKDGVTYDLSKADALKETTLFVIEQDGETFALPRLAVDGGASNAWLKDVVEMKIVK